MNLSTGNFYLFLNLYSMNLAHKGTRSIFPNVMALLTETQSSGSLLGIHARCIQLECHWCHSLGASVLPRNIFGQYQITCIMPSASATQFNAQPYPHKMLLHFSSQVQGNTSQQMIQFQCLCADQKLERVSTRSGCKINVSCGHCPPMPPRSRS